MQRIGLLYHPYKDRAIELSRVWRDAIVARGAPTPLVASAWDDPATQSICNEVDLIITLGGDGTLLRAVRAGAHCGVPAIGAKLGHVGFLSELVPDEFTQHLDLLLQGNYWVEERMMVRAQLVHAGAPPKSFEAINDVVVSRGRLARVIRIHITIDGEWLDDFAADGAIIATATGSTAYSLAAGGPILAPTVRTVLLTLIAPYLSPVHSLVLPEGSHVTLEIRSPLQAMLTIDGQYDIEVVDGDTVQVQASPDLARFARLQEHTQFYRTLIERLREDGGQGR